MMVLGFHAPHLRILYMHNRSCIGQKREGNPVFLLSFDSLIFPCRRLRKTLPAIPCLPAYDEVDVSVFTVCCK